MDQNLVQYFVTQGPFAVLFLCLLWWVLRESARREERLISSLDRITDRLNAQGEQLTGLAHDVADIKQQMGVGGR